MRNGDQAFHKLRELAEIASRIRVEFRLHRLMIARYGGIDMGKCPHCQKTVTSANVEPLNLNAGAESYKGVSYLCPHCRAVLGIQMDPLALNADLAAAISED